MKSRFGAVRADTYERLKKEIIDGRYSPGMLVQISEFARDLGVSRTPVRQALSSLERDFLVDLMDGRGAVIRPLNIDEIKNINQVREVIDGLAARLAAKLMPSEVISDLRTKFESMLNDTDKAESDYHSQLSHNLHKAITDHCGNLIVQAQWKHLNTAFMRLKHRGWAVWRNSEQRHAISMRRLREHLEILEALQNRDPTHAEDAARKHISNATADLLNFM